MADGKPYGPKYQDMCEALLIEHGVGAVAMAVFHYLCRKIDWETGVMPSQLAHSTLAPRVGCKSKDTIYRAIKQLRAAGVVDYATKGNNWDGGEANTYRFAVPTPTRKTHGGAREKDGAPPAKSTGLNPSPSLSRGEKAAPSRREKGPATAYGGRRAEPRPTRKVSDVAPSEVRALLESWGYEGRDIDTFSEREVRGVLLAEGFRLAPEKEGACAPAENEQGEQILPEAHREAAE